jgi:hypothetical protein
MRAVGRGVGLPTLEDSLLLDEFRMLRYYSHEYRKIRSKEIIDLLVAHAKQRRDEYMEG